MHWTRPVPGRQVLLPSPWGFWLECRAPVRSGVKAAALISLYRRSSPPWPWAQLALAGLAPIWAQDGPSSCRSGKSQSPGRMQAASRSPLPPLPLWLHQLRFSRAEDGPRLPLSSWSLPLLLHLPGKASCSRLLLDNPYLIHKQNSLVPTACQSLYQALGMQQRTDRYLPH